MTRNGPVTVTRSAADVLELARLLGHGDVAIYPTRTYSKWFADCACGWSSTGMVRQVEALGAGRYHLANSVRQLDIYARSHGFTELQALSELALTDGELRELDDVMQLRMEHRARVEHL